VTALLARQTSAELGDQKEDLAPIPERVSDGLAERRREGDAMGSFPEVHH
jgi:hypothetical protein